MWRVAKGLVGRIFRRLDGEFGEVAAYRNQEQFGSTRKRTGIRKHQEAIRNQEDQGAPGARQIRYAGAQKRPPLLGKEFKTAGGCSQRGVQ